MYLVGLPLDEICLSWDDDIKGDINIIRQGMQAGIFRKNIESLLKLKALFSGDRPHVSMEIVASKSNYQFIPQNIAYGYSIGIENFIVSNIFPYTKNMENEILYEVGSKPKIDFKQYLHREIEQYNVIIANQSADKTRRCPFIERGSVFITAKGEVAPCPELAYSHPAFYFGSDRMHNRFVVGNINEKSLENIWDDKNFSELRKNFLNYDYSDCSFCSPPDKCDLRTVYSVDCLCNTTPCGECLWAKDIILCP